MGIFFLSKEFQEIESVLSQREKELQSQVELLNLTHDAIMDIDLNGVIRFWNRGAENTYGYSAEEAQGKIIQNLLKTEFPIDRNTVMATAFKNGKPLVVASRWSVKTDQNSKPIGILEINNDISATKEVEARVSEFYSTVSHELRTPLTSIKGSFGLLAGGKVGELSDKGNQLVKIGLAETERLVRLINDILDIKKIEAGKFELFIEDISPQDFIEQTIMSVSSFAEQFNVKLIAQIDSNYTVRGDKDRLIQVLTNLISNAVKFSDSEEAVTIRSSKTDNYVRFSILDKGPGIDSRNVPKLFRMFQQADTSPNIKGGTGLGLAVCKSLVEQHGGSIGVETEVGKGSTFWFEIPCA
jgi:PAS domain S-box-containing protein